MSISVTTTQVASRISDVTYVRTRFGLASSDDTNIGDVLDEITDCFKSYLGRTLSYQVYSESVPGYGEHNLRLTNFPIDTTTVSVVYQAPASTASTSVSSTAWSVDKEAGMLYNSTGWKWTASLKGDIKLDPWPASEHESFTVAYGAGYSVPTSQSTNAGATLPLDLRQAYLRTFKLWWSDLYGGSTSFKKFRTDDLEIENYAPPTDELLTGYGDLPSSVERTLDRFKLEW